ncbi:hypothetical protein GFC01_03105 [Desulfofundulus thermobenzoicus]|uniref:Uncharacterized protein n=1 Tax=Desulfofundulus thermobenzoicus TaxID=29376 RepID=A0A6N7IMQ9_9FIRM|nr:hypothetical protein [Desulfofundulus thermobenzoicus]MQL51265.1 hypothetical protein [Desulfofundulus thermobenzoicus]HHW44366.1 hypothetical protein [Desulfotomaculum sp.]
MFGFFSWRQRKSKLDELIRQVADLEREIQSLKECCRELARASYSPVVVEKLCVERVCVDRLDFTNNLGALGIRELSGNLNIGANYGISRKEGKPQPPPGTGPESRRHQEGEPSSRQQAKGQAPLSSPNPPPMQSTGCKGRGQSDSEGSSQRKQKAMKISFERK